MSEQLLQLEIPSEVENLQLPSPELLHYYQNAENRVFWIAQDIDQSLLELIQEIIIINKKDKDIPVEERKPIKIFVYSYGGELESAYALIDTMIASTTPIWTITPGVAMSVGMLIMIAGSKRLCFKHSRGLIHSGSGGYSGTYEQTEQAMKDYKYLVERARDLIIERTDIDIKLYNKNKSKDWYIPSEEMVQLGICDAVIENIDEVF